MSKVQKQIQCLCDKINNLDIDVTCEDILVDMPSCELGAAGATATSADFGTTVTATGGNNLNISNGGFTVAMFNLLTVNTTGLVEFDFGGGEVFVLYRPALTDITNPEIDYDFDLVPLWARDCVTSYDDLLAFTNTPGGTSAFTMYAATETTKQVTLCEAIATLASGGVDSDNQTLTTTTRNIGTHWVSITVPAAAGSVSNNTGSVDATTSTVTAGSGNNQGTGNRYTVTFPAHPQGANYQVHITPVGLTGGATPNGLMPHIISQTATSVTYGLNSGDDGQSQDEFDRFNHQLSINAREVILSTVTLN